jgi:predicted nucleic acid-binding protein
MPLAEPVVSNSSPLIALATISRLPLLKTLFQQIAIPQAVYNEVVVYGAGEPGSTEVAEAQWIHTFQAKDHLAVNLLRESLDAGESEAIVLAQELKARTILLDDALARRKARLIGLRVTGTMGIVLTAKEAGLIPAVQPILDELSKSDFRMSDRVYREVLLKAEEG